MRWGCKYKLGNILAIIADQGLILFKGSIQSNAMNPTSKSRGENSNQRVCLQSFPKRLPKENNNVRL